MPTARFPRRIWLAPLAGIAFAAAARAVDDPPKPANTAIVPEPRTGSWVKQHEGFLEQARKGDVGVLFLGDSITAGWKAGRQGGLGAPLRPAQGGQPRDRRRPDPARPLAARPRRDRRIKPKVVVLMIGTNNLRANTTTRSPRGSPRSSTGSGASSPSPRSCSSASSPRGQTRPRPDQRRAEPRIARINERIAKLDDGKTVKYLDIGAGFLDADGQVPKEIMPDFLHLSRKGYQIWADAIEPTLWEMVDQK